MLTIAPEPIHSEDARALIADMLDLMRAMYGPDEEFGEIAQAQVTPPAGLFLVARLNGEAVGCAALRQLKPDIGEIKRMFVRDAARGQGVATRLLRQLEQQARDAGYAQIWLETGIYQPAAIHLYEREGYVRMPCAGYFGTEPPSVCYRKTLR
ncbi:MAG: GNAT family N-acetyltransferase [Chloroflexota bacterium]